MLSPLIIGAAQASHKKFYPFGPFVSVTLAQYGLESAWGRFTSGTNNFFGIKANESQIAAGEFTSRWTKEQTATGKVFTIEARFANYASLEDGFNAHAVLLMTAHYQECIAAQTPEQYCEALETCGYATDINYPQKLMEIIKDFNLKQYDQSFTAAST